MAEASVDTGIGVQGEGTLMAGVALGSQFLLPPTSPLFQPWAWVSLHPLLGPRETEQASGVSITGL